MVFLMAADGAKAALPCRKILALFLQRRTETWQMNAG